MTKTKPNQLLDLLLQKGLALHQSDKLDEAKAIYQQILSIEPNHFNALQLLGTLLLKTKDFVQALDLLNKAIKIKPEYPNTYSNKGNVLNELKRYEEALLNYDKAISIQPIYPSAHSNRGIVLTKLKRFEEALASYDKAISFQPNYLDAHFNRGITLKELGRFEEALTSYDMAISIQPNYLDAHFNRAVVLTELTRLDEALACYDKIIATLPNYAGAHSNRGIVLSKLKRFEEALTSYDKAISIQPTYIDAISNRGVALKELKRLDEARDCYNKAISLQPDYADAHRNLSILNLLTGNYEDGWKQNEWRWKTNINQKKFNQPLWLGEQSLKDKTILLYAEQGLGDTIQFSRYVPLVARLGAKVILEVPKNLVNLLKNLEGLDTIIQKGEALPMFDYQCPLLSLPLAFKTNLSNIPPISLNFKTDRDKISKWHNKLNKKSNPLIGIVWSSISHYKNDYLRSITLSELLKALPTEGFDYVCLQKEIKEIDKETLVNNPHIKFFGDDINDFSDDAHLIECVDLVVSTCTSVPHLSSSLGKETWWLLSYVPDWRWLIDRNDSPWYPAAKLYRQEKINDWDSVFKNIKFDLEKKFK